MGITSMPSVTPNQMTGSSDDTTFLSSLTNFASMVSDLFIHKIFDIQDTSELVPNKPVLTINELFKRGELYFVNLDNGCAEYPKLTAPNLKFLPGASVETTKPLPDDLEEFLTGSGDYGTIVVTLGTLKHIKQYYIPKILEKLLATFSRLPQRVIFAADVVKDKEVPENVLISQWIPQNDVLAHPKVKLFITHGGSNGQLEALHHAAPMIVMGVDYDQVYNGRKVEDKGFGKYISAKYFTSDQLYGTIQEILQNNTYKLNLKKCHEIRSSLPGAKEIVTFWVDHVLKFGGSHLRLKSAEVPMYKLFMLDVLVFIVVILILLFISLIITCKCLARLCKFVFLTKMKTD